MLRVVALVSGGGTNLQAIIDRIADGTVKNAEVVGVISNNYNVFSLERAEKAGISVADYEKEDLKSFPMGRYGTTDEYGRLACFLLSEANTYISGQTILLDGAMTQAY